MSESIKNGWYEIVEEFIESMIEHDDLNEFEENISKIVARKDVLNEIDFDDHTLSHGFREINDQEVKVLTDFISMCFEWIIDHNLAYLSKVNDHKKQDKKTKKQMR